MSAFEYLDKRDSSNSPLFYQGFLLADKISDDSMKIIRKNEAFKKLSNYLPEEYVDLYFKKMIYESSLEISHQYQIMSYDKSKNGFSERNYISCNSFPCVELLNKVWPHEKIDFRQSKFYEAKTYLKIFIKRVISSFLLF